MNVSTITFFNTFTAKAVYIMLKAARHPEISVGEEWIVMLDDVYVLALKKFLTERIEGLRPHVLDDSRLLSLLGKREGG